MSDVQYAVLMSMAIATPISAIAIFSLLYWKGRNKHNRVYQSHGTDPPDSPPGTSSTLTLQCIRVSGVVWPIHDAWTFTIEIPQRRLPELEHWLTTAQTMQRSSLKLSDATFSVRIATESPTHSFVASTSTNLTVDTAATT